MLQAGNSNALTNSVTMAGVGRLRLNGNNITLASLSGGSPENGTNCLVWNNSTTAAAILTFLGAWGQYVVPLIFSPTATKPLTVLIPEFTTKYFIDYGLITASGSIAIVVPALVVIFLNRYLVSGLLAGAIK